MWKEFSEFALCGNVVDMAVGTIVGAAFGTIVKSLVDDIIMPRICLLLGTVDLASFFVVALVVFLLMRTINQMRREEVEAARADNERVPLLSVHDPDQGHPLRMLHLWTGIA